MCDASPFILGGALLVDRGLWLGAQISGFRVRKAYACYVILWASAWDNYNQEPYSL